MSSVLERIKLVEFPEDQYFREETPKKQIYLHHTAGNANPFSVVEDWKRTPERVATSFVIAGKPTSGMTQWTDGQIIQCYSSKYWGYHLGLKAANLPPGSKSPMEIQKTSIGIEICNWGWLTKNSKGNFINYVGGIMKPEEVVDLGTPYRGYRYWHNYTDAQIASVKDLLLFLGDRYKIPLTFKGMEIFDIDNRAFLGEPGVYTHTSVRKDKWDIYPHPKMIEMLRGL
jgi:hypothetical protein